MNQNQWKTEDEDGDQLTNELTLNDLSATEKFRKEHPTTPVNEAIKGDVYIPRTYLALVYSDELNYGIVEDTLANIMWVPGNGELVGTWTRTRYDNMIHISLMTSIQALQDRSTITNKKYLEERNALKAAGKKPRRAKAAHEEKQPEEVEHELSVEVQLGFNNLRAKLMKNRRK